MWLNNTPWGDGVSQIISRSIYQRSWSHRSLIVLLLGRGYPRRSPIYNFLLNLVWNLNTKSTYEIAVCMGFPAQVLVHICYEEWVIARASTQFKIHRLRSYQVDSSRWLVTVAIMMTSSNGNIFRVTGLLLPTNSTHKGQWRGVLMFSLICARTNGYANHRDAGDLRRHRANYHLTVMVEYA